MVFRIFTAKVTSRNLPLKTALRYMDSLCHVPESPFGHVPPESLSSDPQHPHCAPLDAPPFLKVIFICSMD